MVTSMATAKQLVESSLSSSCATSEKAKVVAPMDLFDEHWFFSNTLNSKSAKRFNRCNSLPTNGSNNNLDATWNTFKPQKKNQEQEGLVSMRKLLNNSTLDSRLLRNSQQKKLPGADRFFHRSLLRMPSMPSPRNLHDEFDEQKKESRTRNIEKDSPKHRTIVKGPLLRAPSLPAPEISKDEVVQYVRHYSKLRISRLQNPSCSVANNNNYQCSPKSARALSSNGKARQSIFRKEFQEKKWKSYSDLESMEVQALRDLGFVLYNEESSSEKRASNESNSVIKPCLSEAWFLQRSAPPVPKWVIKSSSVDMKEQIKFWARAVACNVREEC